VPKVAPKSVVLPLEPNPAAGPVPQVISFSAGLVSGLAVIAIAAVFFWGVIEEKIPRFWERTPHPPTATASAQGSPEATPPAATPADEPRAVIPPTTPVRAEAPVAPAPPEEAPKPSPTLRDRLRDGSLGPTMAVLPGGSFRMGQNSLGGGDSGPEHEVQVAPFLIGIYEVTFQQFDRFVRASGRRFPDDFGWGRSERPVVAVSWFDAQAYADWLARQTGRHYRLPSESEWEYAARAGGRGSYAWGFKMEPGRAVCFDCGSQWDNRSTAPVGSLAPNAFGLYDMSGNALEWIADCYMPGYEGAPTDGRARVDSGCANRIARGGAFNKPSSSLKVHVRARFDPETRLNMLGFRVARDP
jgi:formylglycine-generating enzyme required for sulfatase activity